MRLSGKKALVTGAARGIGRGCALELARAGADVAVNDYRRPELIEETAAEIRALGRQTTVLEGDVPSPINPPAGCRFHTRCPYAIRECREVVPPLAEIKPNHFAACIRISPAEPHIERVAPGDAPGLRGTGRVIAQ